MFLLWDRVSPYTNLFYLFPSHSFQGCVLNMWGYKVQYGLSLLFSFVYTFSNSNVLVFLPLKARLVVLIFGMTNSEFGKS